MTVSLYCGNWTTRSLHIGVGECKKFAEVPDGGVLIAIQFIKESPPPHPPPPPSLSNKRAKSSLKFEESTEGCNSKIYGG